MTNIGTSVPPGRCWTASPTSRRDCGSPLPTKMDALILTEEGYYSVLGKAGARMEMPGCSLCMGNQAQIRKGSTAISTPPPNFPEPPRHRYARISAPPSWPRCVPGRPHRHGSGVHGADRWSTPRAADVYRWHELRPDQGFCRGGRNGDGVSEFVPAERRPRGAPFCFIMGSRWHTLASLTRTWFEADGVGLTAALNALFGVPKDVSRS